MSLARKAIRKELVNLLTGATYCEDRVFDDRAERVHVRQLPALCVYVLGEQPPAAVVDSPLVYLAVAEFGIEVVADPLNEDQLAAGLRHQDLVDDVLEQARQVLRRHRLLPRLIGAVEIQDDERTGPAGFDADRDAQGEPLLGWGRLRWSVAYLDPQTDEALDDQASALRELGFAFDFPPPGFETTIELDP